LKKRKEDLSVCARARVSDDDDVVTIDFKKRSFPEEKRLLEEYKIFAVI